MPICPILSWPITSTTFPALSLHTLLQKCGLHVMEIDEHSHTSAFIFTARKTATGTVTPQPVPVQAAPFQYNAWLTIGANTASAFKTSRAPHYEVACTFYGSGFLRYVDSREPSEPSRISCFRR